LKRKHNVALVTNLLINLLLFVCVLFRKRKPGWNFACRRCISPIFDVKKLVLYKKKMDGKKCFKRKKKEKKRRSTKAKVRNIEVTKPYI